MGEKPETGTVVNGRRFQDKLWSIAGAIFGAMATIIGGLVIALFTMHTSASNEIHKEQFRRINEVEKKVPFQEGKMQGIENDISEIKSEQKEMRREQTTIKLQIDEVLREVKRKQ